MTEMHAGSRFARDNLLPFSELMIGTVGITDDRKLPDPEDLILALHGLSLPTGTVVIVAVPSSAEILYHIEALTQLGLVPALIAPGTPLPRLKAMLEDFSAGAIIRNTLPMDLGTLRMRDKKQLGSHVIGILDPVSVPQTSAGEIILTTSGTSSEFSSGCVHTIGALRRNARRHAKAIGLRSDDRILIQLPLYYSFAFVAQAIAAIEVGASIWIAPSPFEATAFLMALKTHRITATSLTPRFLKTLSGRLPGRLPTTLRCFTIGGDAADGPAMTAFREAYPDIEVYCTYGISEAGPRVATLAAHTVSPDMYTCLGEPLEATELRLAMENFGDCEGELLVSSDTLLIRKIGRSSLDPTITSGQKRWLRTGDIFRRDEMGALHFKGRRGDFLIVNGEKLNLRAIRNLLRTIPAILDARTRPGNDRHGRQSYTLELVADACEFSEESLPDLHQLIRDHLWPNERPFSVDVRRASRQDYVTVK